MRYSPVHVWVARGWSKKLHFVCSLLLTFFPLSPFLTILSPPPSPSYLSFPPLLTSPSLPSLTFFTCMPPALHCTQRAYQERRYSWLMSSCFLSCQHWLGWEWCWLLFACSSTLSSWGRSEGNTVFVAWSGVYIVWCGVCTFCRALQTNVVWYGVQLLCMDVNIYSVCVMCVRVCMHSYLYTYLLTLATLAACLQCVMCLLYFIIVLLAYANLWDSALFHTHMPVVW